MDYGMLPGMVNGHEGLKRVLSGFVEASLDLANLHPGIEKSSRLLFKRWHTYIVYDLSRRSGTRAKCPC